MKKKLKTTTTTTTTNIPIAGKKLTNRKLFKTTTTTSFFRITYSSGPSGWVGEYDEMEIASVCVGKKAFMLILPALVLNFYYKMAVERKIRILGRNPGVKVNFHEKCKRVLSSPQQGTQSDD